jgi:hypothetical protein
MLKAKSPNRLATLRLAALVACAGAALLAACSSSGKLGKEAIGNWQGNVFNVNDDGYKMEFPVTVIITDADHILIDYPSMDCGGTLIPLPLTGNHVEYREEITYGEDECVNGGIVVMDISRDDKNTLNWRWRRRGEDGESMANANSALTRVPPVEPQTVKFFRDRDAEENSGDPSVDEEDEKSGDK